MASVLESDYRPSSHFPVQGQDYRQAPYTPPPPPPYYVLPSSGCNPAPLQPYIPQYPLLNSIPHISSEYDGFVNGVISDVLIRVDDGLVDKQPYDYKPYEPKIAPENYYNPPQHHHTHNHNNHHHHHNHNPNNNPNLMWGSDVSFGPAGYHPSSPPVTQIKTEPAPLYGIHPVQHAMQSETATATATATPSPVPGQLSLPAQAQAQAPLQIQHQHQHHIKQESHPEPELQLETQDESLQPPELAELNRSGLQKITGKKRRRLLHIIAERNRRLHQNKMYEELYRMVPGLENSSRSTKREVLMRTADWLEDLVDGNRKLQAQLRALPV